MPASTQHPEPLKNLLLSTISNDEYGRLADHFECVDLPFSKVLYPAGEAIRHVYFPNDGMVSLLSTVRDDAALEIGLIGAEGMLGISVFLGVNTSLSRAIVQGEGTALRMRTEAFRRYSHEGVLLCVLQRYTHALLTQISQTAACNRFHAIEARLARWLLMTEDRSDGDEFRMTQEFMSQMLGVYRERVTEAASGLQRKGLIRYSRGHVKVIDRKGLEMTTCVCYEMIKNEYNSFLANPAGDFFGEDCADAVQPIPRHQSNHKCS